MVKKKCNKCGLKFLFDMLQIDKLGKYVQTDSGPNVSVKTVFVEKDCSSPSIFGVGGIKPLASESHEQEYLLQIVEMYLKVLGLRTDTNTISDLKANSSATLDKLFQGRSMPSKFFTNLIHCISLHISAWLRRKDITQLIAKQRKRQRM